MNEELSGLMALDRDELAKRWQAAFGCSAPRYTHSELLRLAIAWNIQADQSGLKSRARQTIRITSSKPSVTLSPGTRLLREWQGTTHHVTVVSGGFSYQAKTFRSLSAIARRITGTPWSGPLFFGLRQ